MTPQAAQALLRDAITATFKGRIALVSSFGTDSAVLLHMVAAIDAATPVLFVDTGKLFAETLAYREALAARLGLTGVRAVRPDPAGVARQDADDTLWQSDPDLCCWHRKVEPLDAALEGFDAWITGRKRFQSRLRDTLPIIEREAGRTKLNPLADWSETDLAAYRALHELPSHPLEALGFRSVGCAPCTRATAAGEDARDGRWSGMSKTECGIHVAHPLSKPAVSGLRS